MSLNGDRLKAAQVGLNSSDLAGSLRLYSELGFRNAGGHMIWGAPMAIQGLSPSARGQLYWLVGRQRRVQLEFFHLTNPMQRPQPQDWRCCDLGWTRFGIAVADLNAAKAVLREWDIPVVAELAEPGEPRRLSFRDPFIGCFVEIMQDGDNLPGGSPARHHDAEPALIYATASVSDLAGARRFYGETLGLDIVDGPAVHGPAHEVLWDLAGANSESFVVDGGGFLLEIVHYLDPVGRPRRADYFVGDQGIMNIAIVSPKLDVAVAAIDRVRAEGCQASETIKIGDAGGAYILEAEREVELGSLTEEHEAPFGYVPTAKFFGE